jgi:hypothetical protein
MTPDVRTLFAALLAALRTPPAACVTGLMAAAATAEVTTEPAFATMPPSMPSASKLADKIVSALSMLAHT